MAHNFKGIDKQVALSMLSCLLNPCGVCDTTATHNARSTYLGSEVHDRVNLLSLQHELDKVCTLDIALDELQAARW